MIITKCDARIYLNSISQQILQQLHELFLTNFKLEVSLKLSFTLQQLQRTSTSHVTLFFSDFFLPKSTRFIYIYIFYLENSIM